jgi:glycosyltransferase involved in cell wall biosynthesis
MLRRSFDALVAVSDDVRDHYSEIVGPGRAAIAVVPNGLPFATLLATARAADPVAVRRRHGVPDGARLVVTVGRLAPEKDHHTLLAALARLSTTGDGSRPPWFVVIAGDGPLDGELRATAARLGVADRVRFAGRLSTPDVLALLGTADIFVLPSRHEGHPVALAEAMACGLACTGSDTTGIRDLLIEGRTGRLHPPGDPAALATVLDDLLADDAQRAALGAAAPTAVAAFDLVPSTDRLLAVYDQVLAGRRR